MTADLSGRVAFVTGGGSGIGRETALAFAAAGASVTVADVTRDAGEETAALIAGSGGTAQFVPCDVTDSGAVQAAIGATLSRFGRLDCAFNNAGILGPMAHVHDYAEEDFDRVIAVHLRGVFLCLKYELQHMRIQRSGAIVNTSSVGGLRGSPMLCAYTAAKHAIIGLTRSAAVDNGAEGIRVNAICPGVIDTPMTQSGFGDVEERSKRVHAIQRSGKPQEIAKLVVWLCSDDASFVTGAPVPIDGGWSAGM